MTANQALQLTVAHNLGSARNTLVPGVEVPAFSTGMDPNQWAARVQAMGISRLQPAGTATSQFKYGTVPGSFDIGSSAPGGDTIMIPKSAEEKAQAIDLLMKTLTPATGADRLSTGRWLFGNDFGGLQQNMLTSAQIDENARQAARRDALAAQAQANAVSQAQRDYNLRLDQQQQAAQHMSFADQLALSDRQQQAAQTAFEDQFKIAQITGQNADTAAYSQAGNNAVDRHTQAALASAQALDGWNNNVLEQADLVNKGPAGPVVYVAFDAHNVATLKSKDPLDPRATALMSELYKSPAGMDLRNARSEMTAAESDIQKLPYMSRMPLSAPSLPQTVSRYQMPGAAGTRQGVAPLYNPRGDISYVASQPGFHYLQGDLLPQDISPVSDAYTPAQMPAGYMPSTVQPPRSFWDWASSMGSDYASNISRGIPTAAPTAPGFSLMTSPPDAAHPQGQVVKVPANRVQEAIAKGYK